MLRQMPLLSMTRCVGSLMLAPPVGRTEAACGNGLYYRRQQPPPIHPTTYAGIGRGRSGRFRQQLALAFTDERLERLGRGAADLVNGIRYGEPRVLGIGAGA